jgi:6-phospho-beta-glucosidase
VKVALVGGGGFRTPLAWEALAETNEGSRVEELVLQDPSERRLTRIAAVIEALRQERPGGPPVRTTTSLTEAVEGAGAVFCAIRVGGLEARVVDETVPLAEGVLGQETVGPGGICFALRTVPVMRAIADVVVRRAPSAWFLNFTNPAGLITEALRERLGDRVVGICDSPAGLCARVAAALGEEPKDLGFDYAGLNHLGWLLAVNQGDEDLLPDLLDDDRAMEGLEESKLFGKEKLRRLGMIPNEYLVYYEVPDAIVSAYRRARATRAQVLLAQQARFYSADAHDDPSSALEAWRRARDERHGTYMAEARSRGNRTQEGAAEHHEGGGEDDDAGPGEAGYATIAARFLRAVSADTGETLALNVANRGRLPFLDDEAVVEVPCSVTGAGPQPQPVGRVPPAQAALVERVKHVERTTLRAALEGSRELAAQALAEHPVVSSRAAAERILSGYLAALPGLARGLR